MTTPAADTSQSTEEALIDIRRQKGLSLRNLGFDPYAVYKLPDNHKTIERIIIDYKPTDIDNQNRLFSTTGRIMSVRGQGGVRFLDLVEDHVKLQLLVSKKDVQEVRHWDVFQFLDIGDIIGVTGFLTITKAGELSLKIKTVTPITKSLIPPTKNGLSGTEDPETKYRQRYRDLIENEVSMNVFKVRSRVVSLLRRFMEEELYSMEVETPVLVPLRGGATAKPFQTHHNALDKDLYLRVAPELYLKRLLVSGFKNVFEIGKNFRNEGLSTRHNPEFTSLEYYQSYADYMTIAEQTERMLSFVFYGVAGEPETEKLKTEPKFTIGFKYVTMADSVKEVLKDFPQALEVYSSWEVFPSGTKTRQEVALELLELMEGSGNTLPFHTAVSKASKGATTDGEFLFGLFEHLAEPRLKELYRTPDGVKSIPVFVLDYPVEVSPLAKKHNEPDQYLKNIVLTQRFELFIEGMEVANAFTELNDPDDQAERFRQQLENRVEKKDDEAMDFDEDYIRALYFGLPSCAGFGLGVDRLVMLLTNQTCIRDVVLFPAMK